jgi:hypothetical protein
MTVGQLRGLAWGSGPALGWITFGGPILKRVENLSDTQARQELGRAPQGSAVKLTWDNPIGYREVQIWRKEASDLSFPTNPIKTFGQGTSQIELGQGKTATIDGLKANTNYQFFVRGRLQ